MSETFRWEAIGDGWRLTPESSHLATCYITVTPSSIGLWTVYIGDRPVAPGNYTSLAAAKRDAWAFARKNRRAFFGAYSISLAA